MMAAHHELDGVPCHGNPELLVDVLRREWGFLGLIVSDADDIYRMFSFHRVAATKDEATVLALRCGVDIEILVSNCYLDVERLVTEGTLGESILDAAVRRVLRAKFELGLFENPFVEEGRAATIAQAYEHLDLARRAAEEAVVLLKNEEGFLPLDLDRLGSVAVIGPVATATSWGTYAGAGQEGTDVLTEIRNRLPASVEIRHALGCRITQSVDEQYNTEIDAQDAIDRPELPRWEEDERLIREAVEVARGSDVALVCVGGNEFTGREAIYMRDHRGDRESIDLVGRQDDLVHAIADTGVPVVLVLANGRPLSIVAASERSRAVLETWFIGSEIGNVVSRILTGELNPSGKLSVTFPRSVGQIPAYYNQKPSGRYRNYLFVDSTPLYPFGHGLTFTTFDYADLRVEPPSIHATETARVSVRVTNTGPRRGVEIVQLYIRDEVSSVTRPVKELKGFARVPLEPGESRIVEFELDDTHLAFTTAAGARTVEAGEFLVMVGSSSADVISTRLVVT